MIIFFVPHSDFLSHLLAKSFSIAVLVHGGAVLYRISVRTALQSAAKPDQVVRKTTIPTIVASKIRASQISTESAVSRLGGEIESSFFFPACFSSALIWATSPASASSWAWVGSCPTCRPNARSRASCGPTLASRRSSRPLLVLSSRYRAVSAASRSSQLCPVGVSGGVAGTDGAGGWFRRFSSSVDAHEREKEKRRTETAAREYSRIYNRLKARKRRGQITVDAWNQQVAQAQALKDAFKARQITREEYVQKLDAL